MPTPFIHFHGAVNLNDPLFDLVKPTVSAESTLIASCSMDQKTTDKSQFSLLVHQTLMEFWLGLCQGEALPLTAALDPFAIRSALGSVMILEPNDDASDFYFRLYGTRIAEVMGRDFSRTWLSAHPAAPTVVFAQQYRAAIALRRCIYSENDAAPNMSYSTRWCRLIMPMADGAGEVNRLFVGNVAVPRERTDINTVLPKS
ncbi:MAG: PAS domain-containing protein [Rhodospirillaceae bacterium]|jgi:hypothetical protein|nr:PAS domain-containing protein [Rhodospirillaceae bacterium]MBT5083676.1 PAS domain-containing protein [Rhodospirillaceae bacterium]MBT5522552.1 PAS domain-containing protein [Rhodospirillaceae bacterium]MBT5878596.1 PAS domain-containing protein [Rhodospirillaceae bacterium]MBT6589806.1 PAS domain-containing protein [Rhodospirillaceae bacterium]